MLANSRYQLIHQLHLTLKNTVATYPSEPHLVEEVGLSQNLGDYPNLPEPTAAWPVREGQVG